jgi:hypothetical protein
MVFVCKLCNLEFEKEKHYWRHNYSKEHIEKIAGINEQTLFPPKKQKQQKQSNAKDNEKNNIDPHLNQQDVKALKGDVLGSGFDINFANNDAVIKCQFIEPQTPTDVVVSDNSNESNFEGLQAPSSKQQRILKYLVDNQSKPEMAKTFFELLKKLDLPDFKMLSTHIISEDSINLLEKQKMTRVIELFKNTLIKKQEGGESVYNGMQITDVIGLL